MEFPWLENSCMVEKNFTGAGMINKAMFKQVQAFRRQGYSNSADVNPKDEKGWTPLHDAAGMGYKDVAKD